MKDWIARAQTEKQRNAQDSASGPKKAADVAISKALEMQLDALSAGGDRAESYLAAQRKLVEARAQFSKAGTDVGAYKVAEQTAQQAATLFGTAAAEGKKQKAARAAIPPPVRKPPVRVVVTPSAPTPTKAAETTPAPVPVQTETAAPAPTVLTEAEVTKRIAEQEERRKKLEEASKPAPAPITPAAVVVTATTLPPITTPTSADLRPAFRAFASGDLASSERLLTGILSAQSAPAEAYLLRGCARYTRAMLSRTPDSLLMAATDDFRAALQRNAALRLDRNAFSPKLVAFFEQVRGRR
jgi:hypothetical protein